MSRSRLHEASVIFIQMDVCNPAQELHFMLELCSKKTFLSPQWILGLWMFAPSHCALSLLFYYLLCVIRRLLQSVWVNVVEQRFALCLLDNTLCSLMIKKKQVKAAQSRFSLLADKFVCWKAWVFFNITERNEKIYNTVQEHTVNTIINKVTSQRTGTDGTRQ